MRGKSLLNTVQAADYLGLSRRTLEGLRHRGGGPTFIRLGRKAVRYSLDDLMAWAEAGRRSSTSDPGPAKEELFKPVGEHSDVK